VRAPSAARTSPRRAQAGDEWFAAFLAHELRTPLAAQRARVELALNDPSTDADGWRAVGEGVLNACRRQERLVDACLTLARSRAEEPRCEPVDLAAVAGEALRAHDLRGLAALAALERATTAADPELLARLADNLVSNAIRHNVPGGRVELATRIRRGRAVLTVANTGPVVPDGELGRLFQPFQRLDVRPRSFADGVGLGLTIVQAIADVHGARVTARARPAGGLVVEVACSALSGRRSPRPCSARR